MLKKADFKEMKTIDEFDFSLRNKGLRDYRHKQANGLAKSRLKDKAKAIKLTASVKEYINDHLRMDWSPEQIAGRLKEDKSVNIHHETIYQYLLKDKQLGGVLYKHLRHQGKPYRKRHGNKHSRNGIPNRVDVDHRPETAFFSKVLNQYFSTEFMTSA